MTATRSSFRFGIIAVVGWVGRRVGGTKRCDVVIGGLCLLRILTFGDIAVVLLLVRKRI